MPWPQRRFRHAAEELQDEDVRGAQCSGAVWVLESDFGSASPSPVDSPVDVVSIISICFRDFLQGLPEDQDFEEAGGPDFET